MSDRDVRQISYSDYLNRVFGCWLGKCVSGTIGAPYEGMKQLLDYEYDPVLIDTLIPNDDLDLQVLWLDVVERKGVHFTAHDLAQAFSTRCPYAPGEYAVFKKNYRRGIAPPLCGSFNNRYYIEGMGSPIRAEIWACLAPGNPALAAQYAAIDGSLDHAGESVYGEQLIAAIEAAAFFESDLDTLVGIGLEHIPADSKLARLIREVCDWSQSGRSWKYVRSQIIRQYGHPSCTSLFQNMGFTMLALYAGGGDLIETTMIALNCGFDTDCTCATAGSILGIIQGADAIMSRHNIPDIGYVLEVDVQRRTNTIEDLARDTARMGCYFAERVNRAVCIQGAPSLPDLPEDQPEAVRVKVTYENDLPAIGIGDQRQVTLSIKNQSVNPLAGSLSVSGPEGWIVEVSTSAISLQSEESTDVKIQITAPLSLKTLDEKNLFTVKVIDGGEAIWQHTFGVVGAALWLVYGPFWENAQTVPKLPFKETYIEFIKGKNEDDRIDCLHRYQNNSRIHWDEAYLDVTREGACSAPDMDDARYEGQLFNLYTDRFSLDEISDFAGPGIYYLERILISPEDRQACLQVGHSDAVQLWVNGEMIVSKENVDWSTGGNANRLNFPIRAGENRIVMKLARHGSHADFSLIIRHTNPWRDHFDDFSSKNPTH